MKILLSTKTSLDLIETENYYLQDYKPVIGFRPFILERMVKGEHRIFFSDSNDSYLSPLDGFYIAWEYRED